MHLAQPCPIQISDSDNTFETEAQRNEAWVGMNTQPLVVNGRTRQQVHRRGLVASGLDPEVKRKDPDLEAQRVAAIDIVRTECSLIWSVSKQYRVAAEAIAGAILWEALENPYHRSVARLGPGKVHPTSPDVIKAEQEEGLPIPKDAIERRERLQDPKVAISYIAAIMRFSANKYKDIGGIDISDNIGVLCTLYQTGNSEQKARAFAARRKADPSAQPQMAETMGPWVENNLEFVKQTLLCT